MKKQHIILIPIIIMLYIIYLIIEYKYNEYKVDQHIATIAGLNESIREKNAVARDLIEYKSSKAYINKIFKQEQNKKNPGEQVLLMTLQSTYEKYTSDIPEIVSTPVVENIQRDITDTMSIKQKWMYFLFKKDSR